MGLLAEPEGLRESFEAQPGNKAPGVDGVRKADYAQGVEDRLDRLSAALRRMGHVPKPVRRVYIPKAAGGRRPLGGPSFEDRIVQDRLSRILQAIWEPEFRQRTGWPSGSSRRLASGWGNSVCRSNRLKPRCCALGLTLRGTAVAMVIDGRRASTSSDLGTTSDAPAAAASVWDARRGVSDSRAS